ncbi:cytochrome c551 [Neobacillus bataviensis]|uniref:cytochrome c551 n=1 Tax=Neobacillus bataviensis TaxID=220685 RepID=UPI001CBC75AE|nr:cytochrome c [Neobacillus bataviensis]
MKKLINGVICIVFLGFLAACGGGNDKDTADNDKTTTEKTEEKAPATNTANADATFQQSCAACHGADLKSGSAPDLDKIGSKYSKAEILDIIEHGKEGGMPAGLLKGDDADAVATWLSEKK